MSNLAVVVLVSLATVVGVLGSMLGVARSVDSEVAFRRGIPQSLLIVAGSYELVIVLLQGWMAGLTYLPWVAGSAALLFLTLRFGFRPDE